MKDNYSPEKRIKELSIKLLKKIFLVIVALVTYWQLYKYIIEKPEIDISIEKSEKINNNYKTRISVTNGSQSITYNDIVAKITIVFNDTIKQIKVIPSKIKPKYLILDKKSVIIDFDLLNKNEQFKFDIITKIRPKIITVNYRIKDIEQINFYDFKNKPKPLNRIFNIWLILLVLSIILFIDALLVISKDKGLQKIKSYIHNFPLNKKNIKKFIKGYEKLYGEYKLRLKPDKNFMVEIINNLFISFPLKTERDAEFIKFLANLKTELYIFYRTRTAFIIISPITFLISIIALFANYFYYEIDIIKNNISINTINKTALTLVLILALTIIIFPRKTMNLIFLKRGAKHKF